MRQICSHPSLIQEDGVAFVDPKEADVNLEFASELARARRLVSPELKASALMRIQAEKEVNFLDRSQQTEVDVYSSLPTLPLKKKIVQYVTTS